MCRYRHFLDVARERACVCAVCYVTSILRSWPANELRGLTHTPSLLTKLAQENKYGKPVNSLMIGNRPVSKLDLPKTFFLVCRLCFRPVAFLSQKNLHSSGLELHAGAPNESLYNNTWRYYLCKKECLWQIMAQFCSFREICFGPVM